MATLLERSVPFFRRHWFVLALLLFFAGLSVYYTATKAKEGRSAMLRWRGQILEIDDGLDIYKRHNYPNPPIMALLLWPIANMPPLAAALTWFYLKVGMTLLSIWWVFRLVEDPAHPFPEWAKAVTVLLALRPIMSDLVHGNVNLFILFLVVGAVYALQRGRPWTAGVVLALGIACKVTPALFVPYLVWKRSWKALGGVAIGLVLFFLVIPGSVLGWEQNVRHLQSWTERLVMPYVAGGFVTTEHNNQSLPGVIYRLTTESPSFSTYIGNQYTPLEYHNVVSWTPHTARWLVKGCMVLFALLVVWSCRTPEKGVRDLFWCRAAECSIVVLGMLLFSERSWKHHYVTLLLPFAVLCYSWAMNRARPLLSGYIIATLAVCWLLMTTTSTGFLPDRTAKLAQVYGAWVWANLLLIAALVVVLRQKDRALATGVAIPTMKNAA